MVEGRDLRNKVCFIDEHAYAVGGLNSKAEKFNYRARQWVQLTKYPLSDNLDSWACALTYVPEEYSYLLQATGQAQQHQGVIINESGVDRTSLNAEEILAQESLIDQEI